MSLMRKSSTNDNNFIPRVPSVVSSILIGMILIGISYTLLLFFTLQSFNFQEFFVLSIAIFTTISMFIAFLISRKGNIALAGLLAAGVSVFSILAVSTVIDEVDYWYLLYMIFPIVLACVLLNRRQSTIFTVITLLSAISVILLNWTGNSMDFLTGPLVFLIATGGFILIANNYFQKTKQNNFHPLSSSTNTQYRDEKITDHLVDISNKTYQIRESETLFKTLAAEFSKLSYDFMIVLFDSENESVHIKYNSINPPLIKKVQELSGVNFETSRKKISEYSSSIQSVINNGKSIYFLKFLDFLQEVIPVPVMVSKQLLNIMGVDENTNGGFLPMHIGEEIIGSFIIWGKNLQEEDLPACKVFASQIASMLEKSDISHSELIKSQDLIETNALLRALNSLSTKMTRTVEIDDVYPILGSELKKLGYMCMVTLLEPDLQTGYFHYCSESKTIRKIERFLGINVHGRRFHQPGPGERSLWIHENKEPTYITSLYSHLVGLFSRVPKQLRKIALSMIDIEEETPAFFLPLISQEKPLGSLTIWGKKVKEDDLPTFKIFADQIANMDEKARLANSESEQAQDLIHSHSLVNALSDVSVKLSSTTNREKLFEILGKEIEKLDYFCMVSKLDKEGEASSFEFINTKLETLSKLEKISGIKLVGYKFPAALWPDSLKSVYLDKQNMFIPDLLEHVIQLFPQVPKAVKIRALEFVGIFENTPAVYVPMLFAGEVIGSIAIWGENLGENDLPAFAVFASQLANALENADLVDAQQEKSRELEHTNTLMNALSEVALKINSVDEAETIYPILGNKLKNLDYQCAVTLINSDYTNARIHYTNANISAIEFIEKNLNIQILGKNFTRETMTAKDIALYEQEQTVFFPNFIEHIYELFTPIPKSILKRAAKMLGISDGIPAVYVPMVNQDQSIGSLMVWGETLREDDLPGFSVFAAQVGNALVNTRLMEENINEIETRKKVQKDLETSRQELQGIFDHAHDAIIIIDSSTRKIVSVNNRACELYKIDDEKFMKLSLVSIIDEGHLIDQLIEETLKNGYCNKLVTHYSMRNDRMTFEINSSLVEYDGKMAIQCINRDITAQEKYEDQLKYAAMHDALTGLPNRALFGQHLDHSIARFARFPKEIFSVLYMDLDNFKRINDSLGHSIGDQFIIEIGARLKDSIRSSDVASRFGGDEFVILLEDTSEQGVLKEFCDRLMTNLSKPLILEGHEIIVSASIGIVNSSPLFKTPEEYLRNADLAMYQSKKAGKNRISTFQKGMHTGELNKLALESQIRLAIKKEEFKLVYQPINSLETGTAISYEALVRWDHPEKGIIPPNEFIPITEFSGLIHPLGKWILKEACQQFQYWRETDDVSIDSTISVNISPIQLMNSSFVDQVFNVLDDTKLPPENLNLEITETALITNPTDARKKLQQIQDRGVKVHLDDFGTGFSSLSFLTTFPIDAIKIDRQFIMALKEQKNFALVRSMQLLTKALGISLIAEGIETEYQLNKLLEMGCVLGQGYYYSKPTDGEKLGFSTPRKNKASRLTAKA